MQQVLGQDWQRLDPVLRRHHSCGTGVEKGWLDIAYPLAMWPVLRVLGILGALLRGRGRKQPTQVRKWSEASREYWARRVTQTNGRVACFDSFCVLAGSHQLVEYVNPLVGLRMSVAVAGGRLCFHGLNFVVKLGSWHISIPEWLLLGHTEIIEEALDDQGFAMDFRMTHPVFGELYRYSGVFQLPPGGEPAEGRAADR